MVTVYDEDGNPEVKLCRVFTNTRRQIYMLSPELVNLMSWKTFYSLLSEQHPQVIVGRRQSDM